MWFDGCYRRKVRQAGVVHELVVHRVRCPRCRAGYAILPDFVVARRLDTAEVIGAAVTAAAGAPGAARGTALLAGVPARTVRSWRARFTAISMPLAIGFSALAAGRGWQPVDLPRATPAHTAMAAIGAAWHTTLTRYPASPLRGPWRFANAMCGGALMAIRRACRGPGDLGASADPGRPDGGGLARQRLQAGSAPGPLSRQSGPTGRLQPQESRPLDPATPSVAASSTRTAAEPCADNAADNRGLTPAVEEFVSGIGTRHIGVVSAKADVIGPPLE